MATEEELAQIQQAHHVQLLAVRELAGDLVDEAWRAYAGFDDVAADQFTSAAVPIVEAARTRTAVLAAGYMAANDRASGIESMVAATVPVIRDGVAVEDLYRRSIFEARRLVSNDTAAVSALDAGRARAVVTARTDVMLVNKLALDDGAVRRPWVVGYRRVLTGKSCALCATASTQRYKRARLSPIHANCDCDVAEIIGERDPGRVVNRKILQDRNITGEAVATEVHLHSEVGPVLTSAGG